LAGTRLRRREMRILVQFFVDGKIIAVLENGSVLDGTTISSEYTADVSYGYNGSFGWNVTLNRGGEVVEKASVGA